MFTLPLELQLLTIESITELESLVALYDSLPSTSETVRDVLLRRIFLVLNQERVQRLETLNSCRLAVFELRDLTGVESLVAKYQGIADGIDEELALTERPVEFRGLSHPSQGRTMLKKENMRERAGSTSPKPPSRRHQANQPDAPITLSPSEAHEAARIMWSGQNDEVCLRTFKNNLYLQQLPLAA